MKASDKIAFFAAGLSIISISLGFYQYYKSEIRQIEHDKQSLRPLLVIEAYQDNNTFVGYLVKNKGVGPALIDSVEIFYNKKRVQSWAALNDIFNKEGNPISIKDSVMIGWHFGDDYVMAPNDVLKLFYRDTLNTKIDYGHLYNVMTKIGLRIHYRSVYDDTTSIGHDPHSMITDKD